MKNVALIFAHPDDAEIWAGGTIINHCDAGDKVKIIYTHIENQIRKTEAKKIEKILSVKVEFADDLNILKKILCDFNPNIIVTHWNQDCHEHHKQTYRLIQQLVPTLLIEFGMRFTLYLCDTYNSMGLQKNDIFIPDTYIDISSVWNKKMALIDLHDSQPVDLWKKMIERQNRICGARTYVQYAEGFKKISTLGYQIGYTRVLE